MEVHKLEICIVDFDGLGAEGVKNVLENTTYPNRCISPDVIACESREVEWSDDHPLNIRSTSEAAFKELFREKTGD